MPPGAAIHSGSDSGGAYAVLTGNFDLPHSLRVQGADLDHGLSGELSATVGFALRVATLLYHVVNVFFEGP